jgi:hypothetical protein
MPPNDDVRAAADDCSRVQTASMRVGFTKDYNNYIIPLSGIPGIPGILFELYFNTTPQY